MLAATMLSVAMLAEVSTNGAMPSADVAEFTEYIRLHALAPTDAAARAATEFAGLLIQMPGPGKTQKEISKSRIPNFPNFLGFVLGCIEAKFCK